MCRYRVQILTSPRAVIRSDASQPPSYTQLFRAEEGGEGVGAGGAGSVSSLGSPPPYTSGGSQSLYTTHLHINQTINVCVS